MADCILACKSNAGQGGSRTSLDDSTKRYVCDRNDLQKQKDRARHLPVRAKLCQWQEEKGEYSYINAAKDVKAEERAQKQAEKEERIRRSKSIVTR